MAKPKPIRVPSDDCEIKLDGETFRPHEGEWVEMLRGQAVGEIAALNTLRQLGPKMAALEGEAGGEDESLVLVTDAFEQCCRYLSRRVVRWSWTDDLSRPLPQPDGTAEPFKALRDGELGWLLTATGGETPAERKNGSRPSPTTS